MKIVFVCAEYPFQGRATGGFGTYVKNISEAIVKQGHAVTVLCQSNDDIQELENGVTIIGIRTWASSCIRILKSSSVSILTRVGSFLEYPLGFGIRVMLILRKLNKTKSVDIVEGGDFGAELFFYMLFHISARPKVIIKLHTPSFVIRQYNKESKGLFYSILEFMENHTLKIVDVLYSPSLSLATLLENKLNTKVKKIIPYPLPNIRTSGQNKRDPNTLLYVGKLQRKKGVFVLVEAFNNLLASNTQSTLYFIGPDTREKGRSVKRMLQELLTNASKPQVTFLDQIPQSQLLKYYARAAITVVPSLWDNYPNVALEAVMSGSTVVTTNNVGLSEILKHGKEVIIVRPDDSAGLTEALISILKNAKKRASLSSNAKKKVMRILNPTHIAKLTIEFYSVVVKEK